VSDPLRVLGDAACRVLPLDEVFTRSREDPFAETDRPRYNRSVIGIGASNERALRPRRYAAAD